MGVQNEPLVAVETVRVTNGSNLPRMPKGFARSYEDSALKSQNSGNYGISSFS